MNEDSDAGFLARLPNLSPRTPSDDGGFIEEPSEVPPGSLPEEVADDIPAQLSEGEYVIPADVVRWFGVKHLESMRHEAKNGFMTMQGDGRLQAYMGEGTGHDGSPEHESMESPEYEAKEGVEGDNDEPLGYASGGLVQNPFDIGASNVALKPPPTLQSIDRPLAFGLPSLPGTNTMTTSTTGTSGIIPSITPTIASGTSTPSLPSVRPSVRPSTEDNPTPDSVAPVPKIEGTPQVPTTTSVPANTNYNSFNYNAPDSNFINTGTSGEGFIGGGITNGYAGGISSTLTPSFNPATDNNTSFMPSFDNSGVVEYSDQANSVPLPDGAKVGVTIEDGPTTWYPARDSEVNQTYSLQTDNPSPLQLDGGDYVTPFNAPNIFGSAGNIDPGWAQGSSGVGQEITLANIQNSLGLETAKNVLGMGDTAINLGSIPGFGDFSIDPVSAALSYAGKYAGSKLADSLVKGDAQEQKNAEAIGGILGTGAGLLLAPSTFGLSLLAAPFIGSLAGGTLGAGSADVPYSYGGFTANGNGGVGITGTGSENGGSVSSANNVANDAMADVNARLASEGYVRNPYKTGDLGTAFSKSGGDYYYGYGAPAALANGEGVNVGGYDGLANQLYLDLTGQGFFSQNPEAWKAEQDQRNALLSIANDVGVKDDNGYVYRSADDTVRVGTDWVPLDQIQSYADQHGYLYGEALQSNSNPSAPYSPFVYNPEDNFSSVGG